MAADEALRDPGTGSIADALERLVPSPGARAAVAARLAVSSAYELDDQDAATLAEGAARFGDFPSHGVAGGNDGIALALAERLGGAVRTSTSRPPGRLVGGRRRGACGRRRGGGGCLRDRDAGAARARARVGSAAARLEARGTRGRPLRPGREALPPARSTGAAEPDALRAAALLDLDSARDAPGRLVLRRFAVGAPAARDRPWAGDVERTPCAGSAPTWTTRAARRSSRRGTTTHGLAARTRCGHCPRRSTTRRSLARSAWSRSPASTPRGPGTR